MRSGVEGLEAPPAGRKPGEMNEWAFGARKPSCMHECCPGRVAPRGARGVRLLGSGWLSAALPRQQIFPCLQQSGWGLTQGGGFQGIPPRQPRLAAPRRRGREGVWGGRGGPGERTARGATLIDHRTSALRCARGRCPIGMLVSGRTEPNRGLVADVYPRRFQVHTGHGRAAAALLRPHRGRRARRDRPSRYPGGQF